MDGDAGTPTEAAVPLWETISPRTPSPDDATPRSRIYTPDKLANDYALYLEGTPGFDPEMPLAKKQTALFKLLEQPVVLPDGDEVSFADDPIQAWEFMLGRKYDEWDAEEQRLVWDNLPEDQRTSIKHLFKDI